MSYTDRLDVFGLRRRVSDRIARLIDYRVEQHPRLSAKLNRVCERLDNQRSDLDTHQERLAEQRRRLDDLERRVADIGKTQRWTANELERMIPQVAAQESQLESLRDKLAAVPAASRPELDEARSLIDEVRREHAKVRARLTGIARYEERLGRLEERAAEPDHR